MPHTKNKAHITGATQEFWDCSCGKHYNNKKGLELHHKFCYGESKYSHNYHICDICGVEFSNRITAQKHRVGVHKRY